MRACCWPDLHIGLGTAWDIGVKNYPPGDALKIAIAAGLLPGAWLLIEGRHRNRQS
jgi:hypothetical protein